MVLFCRWSVPQGFILPRIQDSQAGKTRDNTLACACSKVKKKRQKMKTETPGFYPAARGAWEPNWGVIEQYISFVYKLKQPKALCCCSRNGLGKQVILLGLTQEPHLKNYRFSVTWYGDHHTRRGKLTGWPDSLDLSEDDLLNLPVGYAIQYGRHRGQGVPSGFLAPPSAVQTQCWGVTPRYIWLQNDHVCDVAITRKVSQT